MQCPRFAARNELQRWAIFAKFQYEGVRVGASRSEGECCDINLSDEIVGDLLCRRRSGLRVVLIIQVRPLSTKELVNDEAKACVQVDEAAKQIKIGQDKRFTFDHVFGPESGQSAVYDGCVKGLVDGCLAGYNSCILAYGQTVRHDEMLRPSDPFPVQCVSIAPSFAC